jgi:hypothetical protein
MNVVIYCSLSLFCKLVVLYTEKGPSLLLYYPLLPLVKDNKMVYRAKNSLRYIIITVIQHS